MVPAERELAAALPAERVKEAKRLRSDRGVVELVGVVASLSGVAAARLAVQVALRLKGGVMGSDEPEEVDDDSIEDGMEAS